MDSWSAQSLSININPLTYPGGYIEIMNITAVDIFGNAVDKFAEIVELSLSSTDLNFQVNFDLEFNNTLRVFGCGNFDCQRLFIQGATDDDFGKNYTFKVEIENNVLNSEVYIYIIFLFCFCSPLGSSPEEFRSVEAANNRSKGRVTSNSTLRKRNLLFRRKDVTPPLSLSLSFARARVRSVACGAIRISLIFVFSLYAQHRISQFNLVHVPSVSV